MKSCRNLAAQCVIKIVQLLLIILLYLGGGQGVYAQSLTVKVKDNRLTPEQFPVFPWDELPADRASYRESYDCGFNLAGFAQPENLNLIHSAGMKCFVRDPRIMLHNHLDFTDAEIQSNATAVVQSAATNPAVFGYHLVDEPDPKIIPTVAKWMRAVGGQIPSNQLAYSNLFPVPFDDKALTPEGIEKYKEYLTSFIELSHAKVFSWDNYALLDDGSLRPQYYLNFEIAREVSLKSGVPFWFVGLACAHFHYTEPTYATLRFQVNSALAYGVRGIGWFTYEPRDRGNYRSTAMDFDGRRTPTWDMLRAANMQIHRLGPVYLQLHSVNVFHYPQIPVGCHGIQTSHYLKGLKGDGNYLVGEFEGPAGKPYFLVVNKSLTRSAHYWPILKTNGKLMKVSSFTGDVGPWSAENDWLAPGQGMLLFVDAVK